MATTQQRLTIAREAELAAWRAIDAAYEVQRKATAQVNLLQSMLIVESIGAKPKTQKCYCCGKVEPNDGRGFAQVRCKECTEEAHREWARQRSEHAVSEGDGSD